MPEGPEVRRYAATLHEVLAGERIIELSARTKAAKAWLAEHSGAFTGRKVRYVRAHGKNLFARIEGDLYFYSHLMMWGRWQIEENDGGEFQRDRRERARISTQHHHAILLSAPVFEVGEGDPRREVEMLRRLGPDILPYEDDGDFDEHEFLKRLLSEEGSNSGEREIGVALLDQTICAGIGNYLRAEILFECKLDPWRRIAELSPEEIRCIVETVPRVAAYAYAHGGATADEEARETMRRDESMVYVAGREYGTRHYVFRRTNLPCVRCGDTIRQKRQTTHVFEDGEKLRITYFCPTCQSVPVEAKKPRRKVQVALK